MRLREGQRLLEPGGVITQRSAEKKYNIRQSTIRSWILGREVLTVQREGREGLDEASLQRRIAGYTPHRDNQVRRRGPKGLQASPTASPAHTHPGGVNGVRPGQFLFPAQAGAPGNGHSRLGRTIPEILAAQQKPVAIPGRMSTREWVERFVEAQTRLMGGELRANTRGNYDWAFERFIEAFPVVPLDREDILKYIYGLTDRHPGQAKVPLSDGSKALALRNLRTFYGWLGRNYKVETPDLDKPELSTKRTRNVPIYPVAQRKVLALARDHSEYTIILALAQTGMRIGEICTVRKETLRDGWVYVWGKPTAANKAGQRKVPLPDPVYEHIRREVELHGSLAMGGIPLAGPLEPEKGYRGVNWEDEKSFIVWGMPGAPNRVRDSLLRPLMKRAGVWMPGMGAHSFRRAYQSQFVDNGGSKDAYRQIMGHFNISNMDDLYNHWPIEQIVRHARRYAPRRILDEETEEQALERDRHLETVVANLAEEELGDGDGAEGEEA